MGIYTFNGKYFFLSNFFWQEMTLPKRLWGYRSMEHYYQAMKCEDPTSRVMFKEPRLTAGQAKRRGRAIPLRPDWEEIKDDVMLTGLRRKFAPGTELAGLLLDTGDEYLEEGNVWHDNYWGNCGCNRKACETPGYNVLGRMLMQVRDELRQ